ncbi:hypothetical protein LB506_007085 [Fusarium annulatum]|nr:hypothetical protein LB506_007085 [Fusarium annulatum]
MASSSLPNSTYTVGWICALPIEMAAATAVLDEVHGPPQQLDPNDHNTYTLGRIHSHNVAIACLPAGNYGIAPAASIAHQMLTSFTGIKFGLLVGIGGGIPQPGHDIRLGDVVVSQPKGQLGGVVQYDRGKHFGVYFERTGWLNSPPEVLLTGLSKLKARRWMGETQMRHVLELVSTKYPKFARPKMAHDTLHRDDENGREPPDTDSETRFSDGDTRKGPLIHFGTIASGNQVIKDAATRERLQQELGNVLCFEMEAAGLMNSFPCLVIRGISDYADYHKNDIWQPYASATAAAFAKELLSIIHARDVRNENAMVAPPPALAFQWVGDGREIIADAVKGTCTWLPDDDEYKEWKQQETGLLWLTGKPGSGKSTLLKYASMVDCERSRNDLGNTIILTFFFHGGESGPQQAPMDFYRALLYQLIVKYRDQLWNRLVGLVEAFQRSSGRSISDHGEPNWHCNEMDGLLQSCIKKVREAYAVQIMVDALDECNQGETLTIEEFFKAIRAETGTNLSRLSICITCRHFPIVKWQEGREIHLEQRNEADIRVYLRNSLDPFEDHREGQALEDEIVERSSGVFLWVKLVLPTIILQQRKGLNHEQLLQSLQQSSFELEDIFSKIIQQLVHEPQDRVWSLRLFQWLCFARRPLSVAQFISAMNVSVNDQCSSLKQCLALPNSIRSENQMLKRLRSLSGGLAELREHNGVAVIRLIHQSAKDFLINRGFQALDRSLTSHVIVRTQANICLMQACTRYLAMDEIVNCDVYTPLENLPFLDYAVMSWILHAEEVEKIRMLRESVILPFQWPSERAIHSWIRAATRSYKTWPVPGTTLLHAAARHGLISLMMSQVLGSALLCRLILYLLTENWAVPYPVIILLRYLLQLYIVPKQDINHRDHLGRTPLALAVIRGHRKIVQTLLFRSDTDSGAPDKDGRTPLSWAAAAGRLEIMELLLANPGINIDLPDSLKRTPLMWAAAGGNESAAARLVQGSADVFASDHDGTTALHLAAEGGHEGLARVLISHGASTEARDNRGRTSLHAAALYGHMSIVQLLLNKGADIKAVDKEGDTVLHRLAGNKDPQVARGLLKNESDLVTTARVLMKASMDLNHAVDFNGGTPLHRAASNGRQAVAEVLLENGAIINAEDHQKQTPLLLAMKNREKAMVELLLEKGAATTLFARKSTGPDFPIRRTAGNTFGRSRLEAAARAGNEDQVIRLLDQGSRITLDELTAAAEKGHEAIVKLFLDRKPTIAHISTMMVGTRRTSNKALESAARNGHGAVVRLLIANGANVNPEGYGSPLDAASSSYPSEQKTRWEDVIRILLNNGASAQSRYYMSLHSAASWGSKGLIQLLLDAGACPTFHTLERAAEHGNEPVVHLLLERGVKITPKALSEAAYKGHESILRHLVANGGAATEETLDNAIFGGHEATVKFLLGAGVAPGPVALAKISKRTSKAILCLLLDANVKPTSEALRRAAETGNEAAFKLLLSKGLAMTSDTLAKAIEGESVAIVRLHLDENVEIVPLALENATHTMDISFIRLLLEKGYTATPACLMRAISFRARDVIQALLEKDIIIPPEALASAIEADDEATILQLLGKSVNPTCQALEAAIAKGNETMVRLLLDMNVPATEKALHIAIRGNHITIIRLLFEREPQILQRAQRDSTGKTVLHTACMMQNLAIAQLLIQHGVDINAVSHYFGTALHAATREGQEEMVSLLLQSGADSNVLHHYEDYPLSIASADGHKHIVQLLLENNADVNLKPYRGARASALVLAVENENIEIVQLLLQHGADVERAKGDNTILELAITVGNERVIRLLRDYMGSGIEEGE